ncbi:MAG: hypothetical protein AAFY03_11505, partial [Pseudomonadota bacterium]
EVVDPKRPVIAEPVGQPQTLIAHCGKAKDHATPYLRSAVAQRVQSAKAASSKQLELAQWRARASISPPEGGLFRHLS